MQGLFKLRKYFLNYLLLFENKFNKKQNINGVSSTVVTDISKWDINLFSIWQFAVSLCVSSQGIFFVAPPKGEIFCAELAGISLYMAMQPEPVGPSQGPFLARPKHGPARRRAGPGWHGP